MNSKRSCLFLNGGGIDLSFAREVLKDQKFDLVVAADAGVKAAVDLGYTIDYAIGDFDTLGMDVFEQQYKSFVRHAVCLDVHKDETDSEAAVHLILSKKIDTVIILGSIGTRLDHTLANISLLELFLKKGMDAVIYQEHNKVYLVDHERQVIKDDRYRYFSFLPFSKQVKGLSLKGFAYPLDHADFDGSDRKSLGISNEFIDKEGTISIEEGIVLIIESRD